jgi:hypothetical protein
MGTKWGAAYEKLKRFISDHFGCERNGSSALNKRI